MVARHEATKDLGDRILKVDHAGEHGAVNIYRGQILIARLTARHLVDELKAFGAHEQRHRAIFAAELHLRDLPRCRSYLLCGMSGYALGLITGLLGAGAISATTAAVERVVLRHLQHQLAVLRDNDPHAVAAISAIIADEQQHHDASALHLDGDAIWPRILSPLVSASTEAVIWLGMRL
ncbi:demethoxyubiquinone hydroxylase family protein [Pseudoxanthomonas composti]|uniref:Demethoxyubiquinone hydroxylase family protein n=2 Tax=Pseudoxanthomonas composti TaxID=2137479 RepID=A0A4Q1JXX2_9GAMM|nr:demethoxyubiquinone hydroxylase family protein [Pseudoxanthomonas composti]